MNLVRSLCVLATSIVVAGVVQAESASLYMKIRKSLPLKLQQPAASSAYQPIAELSVTPTSEPTTQLASLQTDQSSAPSATQTAAPEMQPRETILPKGARVVAGDETKDEFYILTEDQPDPVRHLSPAVVEKQLKRMDAPRLLWAFNQLPRVDVILSQIAHKVTGTKVAPESSFVSTISAPPKAEKNGDIADIQVALDKTFAESYKHVVKPPHKIVKNKVMVDVKPHRKLVKSKIVLNAKPQHKSIKTKTVVGIKPQHNVIKDKVATVKSRHKSIKDKKVVDARRQSRKSHYFWRIEKPSAATAKKHPAHVAKRNHLSVHMAAKRAEHHSLPIINKKHVLMSASRRVSTHAIS